MNQTATMSPRVLGIWHRSGTDTVTSVKVAVGHCVGHGVVRYN